MPTRFSRLPFSRLRQIVADRVPKDLAVVRAFLEEGDHYQGGRGFVGPSPRAAASGSEAEQRSAHAAEIHRAAVIALGIERGFTPEDLLGEIRDRRTDVLAQKEPQWSVELDDEWTDPEAPEEDGEAGRDPVGDDEADVREDPREPERRQIGAALGARWDGAGLHDVLKRLADTVTAYGRAVVQITVPSGLLQERVRMDAAGRIERGPGGRPLVERYLPVRPDGTGSAEEALDAVFVDVWTPEQAAEVVDPVTRGVGVVLSVEASKDALTGDPTLAACVVAFVDGPDSAGNRATVVRTVTNETDTEVRFDLGGLPLMREAKERRRFITPAMLAQQRALNTASTEMRLVNDKTGFQRHILTNAMPPTIEVTRRNPETGQMETAEVDVEFNMGPGDFAVVSGTEIEDTSPQALAQALGEDGEAPLKGRDTPGVHTLPPGDPASLKLEMGERRAAMLRRARQLYALITGDADVSGESRIAALYDLMNDAGSLKSVLDGEGKWLLEAMWAVACHLAGTPERRLDRLGLKVVFDCRLTLPMPTAGQVASYIELVKEEIWAPQTAQAATGIDDTDAEEDRIRRARAGRGDVATLPAKERAELAQILSGAGVDVYSALEFAGFDDEEAAGLTAQDRKGEER